MKMFVNFLAKTEDSVWNVNPIESPVIRKNQFRMLRSLKLGEMVSFGNFPRKGSICAGFHSCRLHGSFFH